MEGTSTLIIVISVLLWFVFGLGVKSLLQQVGHAFGNGAIIFGLWPILLIFEALTIGDKDV